MDRSGFGSACGSPKMRGQGAPNGGGSKPQSAQNSGRFSRSALGTASLDFDDGPKQQTPNASGRAPPQRQGSFNSSSGRDNRDRGASSGKNSLSNNANNNGSGSYQSTSARRSPNVAGQTKGNRASARNEREPHSSPAAGGDSFPAAGSDAGTTLAFGDTWGLFVSRTLEPAANDSFMNGSLNGSGNFSDSGLATATSASAHLSYSPLGTIHTVDSMAQLWPHIGIEKMQAGNSFRLWRERYMSALFAQDAVAMQPTATMYARMGLTPPPLPRNPQHSPAGGITSSPASTNINGGKDTVDPAALPLWRVLLKGTVPQRHTSRLPHWTDVAVACLGEAEFGAFAPHIIGLTITVVSTGTAPTAPPGGNSVGLNSSFSSAAAAAADGLHMSFDTELAVLPDMPRGSRNVDVEAALEPLLRALRAFVGSSLGARGLQIIEPFARRATRLTPAISPKLARKRNERVTSPLVSPKASRSTASGNSKKNIAEQREGLDFSDPNGGPRVAVARETRARSSNDRGDSEPLAIGVEDVDSEDEDDDDDDNGGSSLVSPMHRGVVEAEDVTAPTSLIASPLPPSVGSAGQLRGRSSIAGALGASAAASIPAGAEMNVDDSPLTLPLPSAKNEADGAALAPLGRDVATAPGTKRLAKEAPRKGSLPPVKKEETPEPTGDSTPAALGSQPGAPLGHCESGVPLAETDATSSAAGVSSGFSKQASGASDGGGSAGHSRATSAGAASATAPSVETTNASSTAAADENPHDEAPDREKSVPPRPSKAPVEPAVVVDEQQRKKQRQALEALAALDDVLAQVSEAAACIDAAFAAVLSATGPTGLNEALNAVGSTDTFVQFKKGSLARLDKLQRIAASNELQGSAWAVVLPHVAPHGPPTWDALRTAVRKSGGRAAQIPSLRSQPQPPVEQAASFADLFPEVDSFVKMRTSSSNPKSFAADAKSLEAAPMKPKTIDAVAAFAAQVNQSLVAVRDAALFVQPIVERCVKDAKVGINGRKKENQAADVSPSAASTKPQRQRGAVEPATPPEGNEIILPSELPGTHSAPTAVTSGKGKNKGSHGTQAGKTSATAISATENVATEDATAAPATTSRGSAVAPAATATNRSRQSTPSAATAARPSATDRPDATRSCSRDEDPKQSSKPAERQPPSASGSSRKGIAPVNESRGSMAVAVGIFVVALVIATASLAVVVDEAALL